MYKIISGIFKGKTFSGTPITICGESRIWDDDSCGRSYPAENCELIKN